jgi:hemerythrin
VLLHQAEAHQFDLEPSLSDSAQYPAVFHHRRSQLAVAQALRSANPQIAMRMEALMLQFLQDIARTRVFTGLACADNEYVTVLAGAGRGRAGKTLQC